MLSTFYALIRPKTTLQEKFPDEDLDATLIWTFRWAGRGLGTTRDVLEGIKLLFLAEQLNEARLENKKLKLGIDNLDVSLFDEFWELELDCGPHDEVEEILRSYRGTEFESKLIDTGNALLMKLLG